MPLVSERDKQTDLVDLIRNAADQYETGIVVETHHRLASEFDQVSRRTLRNVMGDPFFYAEVLPSGSPTNAALTGGGTSSVAHAFDVWLAYEYEEGRQYAGSTQETFDNLTEGLSPDGILPALRGASCRTIANFKGTYGNPVDISKNIIPLTQEGGTYDRVHRLQFEITIQEPS